MIIFEQNEMILKKEGIIVNKLKWSIAGGNTRLITEVLSEKNLEELMSEFIDNCASDKAQIIPLDVLASQYFEKNHIDCELLRGLDRKLISAYIG